MSVRRALSTVGLAATLLLSGANGALAQPSDDDVVVARETFRAGEAAYKRGDFETAANSFEVSHRLAPHSFTMFNAGLAWEKVGEPARAADAFHKAIALGGLGQEQLAKATERLAALRNDLGAVHVAAPAEATVAVGHVDRGQAPLVVHLHPGEHAVAVRYEDGREEQRSVSVQAGATARVTFAPPPKAPPALPSPAPAPRMSTDEGLSGLFIGGWVAMGIGIAAGGSAIGLGVAALSARDDFEASANTDAGARDRAATLRTVTNVMWGVAGAGVVTGTILVLVGWDDGAGDDVTLDLGPGHLGLRGRF